MSVHDFVYTFISSFITLFPVVNPIGSAFIVNGSLGDLDDTQRKSAIRKIIFNCLLISVGSLVAGHLILLLFGLAIPVIQVGGGIIICKTGWDWLSDSQKANITTTHDGIHSVNTNDVEKQLFYPLSFPISIGPGTISVIFTLMATASVKNDLLKTGINYGIIILVIVILLIIFYFLLKEGPRITKKLGHSGNLIINKLIAFITFCIGIQIIITGISKIFHLTIL